MANTVPEYSWSSCTAAEWVDCHIKYTYVWYYSEEEAVCFAPDGMQVSVPFWDDYVKATHCWLTVALCCVRLTGRLLSRYGFECLSFFISQIPALASCQTDVDKSNKPHRHNISYVKLEGSSKTYFVSCNQLNTSLLLSVGLSLQLSLFISV